MPNPQTWRRGGLDDRQDPGACQMLGGGAGWTSGRLDAMANGSNGKPMAPTCAEFSFSGGAGWTSSTSFSTSASVHCFGANLLAS